VVRAPMEDVDTHVFDELEADDILFIDNSHRIFQNSDANVFFLEVLPRLRPGVIVHVHDIFLPFDYPEAFAGRYYSEQYLLAAYLIAGYQRIEVLLPVAWLSQQEASVRQINEAWAHPVFQRSFSRSREGGGSIGSSFWLRMGE